MLIIFWDIMCPILPNLWEHEQTLTNETYSAMPKRKLKPAVRSKRRGMLSKCWRQPFLTILTIGSWNALSVMVRSSLVACFLNLFYCLETTSFQSGFKFGKEEKKYLLGLGPENRVNGEQLMSGVMPDNCWSGATRRDRALSCCKHDLFLVRAAPAHSIPQTR